MRWGRKLDSIDRDLGTEIPAIAGEVPVEPVPAGGTIETTVIRLPGPVELAGDTFLTPEDWPQLPLVLVT